MAAHTLTSKRPIYLDYAATTPVDPRVADKMWQYLRPEGEFGNAASRLHRYGWMADEAIDIARHQVAALIHADAREIVWTSGATEADNLALKSVARAMRARGNHIITCQTEHKAVLDSCHWLQQEGFELTYLQPEKDGLLDLNKLASALRKETILVAVMHVNNELGVIQDIAAIGALLRERGIAFHVDAAQSLGKIAMDVRTLPVDFMAFSGHKIYGPKGIGALYVRKDFSYPLEAQIHGGGHEWGLRSGTLATHQIVGMGEACAIAEREMIEESLRLQAFKDKFWQALQAHDVHLNGSLQHTVPGILNVSFCDVLGDALIPSLQHTMAVSSGAACTSAQMEPSYVLRALGLSRELAMSAVRFSFGRFTTDAEIEQALQTIAETLPRLRL